MKRLDHFLLINNNVLIFWFNKYLQLNLDYFTMRFYLTRFFVKSDRYFANKICGEVKKSPPEKGERLQHPFCFPQYTLPTNRTCEDTFPKC